MRQGFQRLNSLYGGPLPYQQRWRGALGLANSWVGRGAGTAKGIKLETCMGLERPVRVRDCSEDSRGQAGAGASSLEVQQPSSERTRTSPSSASSAVRDAPGLPPSSGASSASELSQTRPGRGLSCRQRRRCPGKPAGPDSGLVEAGSAKTLAVLQLANFGKASDSGGRAGSRCRRRCRSDGRQQAGGHGALVAAWPGTNVNRSGSPARPVTGMPAIRQSCLLAAAAAATADGCAAPAAAVEVERRIRSRTCWRLLGGIDPLCLAAGSAEQPHRLLVFAAVLLAKSRRGFVVDQLSVTAEPAGLPVNASQRDRPPARCSARVRGAQFAGCALGWMKPAGAAGPEQPSQFHAKCPKPPCCWASQSGHSRVAEDNSDWCGDQRLHGSRGTFVCAMPQTALDVDAAARAAASADGPATVQAAVISVSPARDVALKSASSVSTADKPQIAAGCSLRLLPQQAVPVSAISGVVSNHRAAEAPAPTPPAGQTHVPLSRDRFDRFLSPAQFRLFYRELFSNSNSRRWQTVRQAVQTPIESRVNRTKPGAVCDDRREGSDSVRATPGGGPQQTETSKRLSSSAAAFVVKSDQWLPRQADWRAERCCRQAAVPTAQLCQQRRRRWPPGWCPVRSCWRDPSRRGDALKRPWRSGLRRMQFAGDESRPRCSVEIVDVELGAVDARGAGGARGCCRLSGSWNRLSAQILVVVVSGFAASATTALSRSVGPAWLAARRLVAAVAAQRVRRCAAADGCSSKLVSISVNENELTSCRLGGRGSGGFGQQPNGLLPQGGALAGDVGPWPAAPGGCCCAAGCWAAGSRSCSRRRSRAGTGLTARAPASCAAQTADEIGKSTRAWLGSRAAGLVHDSAPRDWDGDAQFLLCCCCLLQILVLQFCLLLLPEQQICVFFARSFEVLIGFACKVTPQSQPGSRIKRVYMFDEMRKPGPLHCTSGPAWTQPQGHQDGYHGPLGHGCFARHRYLQGKIRSPRISGQLVRYLRRYRASDKSTSWTLRGGGPRCGTGGHRNSLRDTAAPGCPWSARVSEMGGNASSLFSGRGGAPLQLKSSQLKRGRRPSTKHLVKLVSRQMSVTRPVHQPGAGLGPQSSIPGLPTLRFRLATDGPGQCGQAGLAQRRLRHPISDGAQLIKQVRMRQLQLGAEADRANQE
uniref:Protein kinase domain-containing protein n=1 Tax=Macrostomum lignano TaxID=282301 RepID=A0A1I8FES4_9PLAT